MKPILAVVAFLAFIVGVVAVASPQPKVEWCHFPPGQWTGNRLTSMVVVQSIDRNAINGHTNHPGDGPVASDSSLPPGFQNGLGPDCSGCGSASVNKKPSGTTAVTLHNDQNGHCVCPVGTSIGDQPSPNNVPVAGSCGTLD